MLPELQEITKQGARRTKCHHFHITHNKIKNYFIQFLQRSFQHSTYDAFSVPTTNVGMHISRGPLFVYFGRTIELNAYFTRCEDYLIVAIVHGAFFIADTLQK